MQKFLSFTLLILFSFLFCACEYKEPSLRHILKPDCQYYSLKSAQCQNIQEMIEKLVPYKVIFIGDHHPKDDLHRNIAKLITAFSQNGIKVHLANEWFYPGDTDILDAFSSMDINETEFLKQIQWEERLKFYPYNSFKPMYEAVQQNKGRLHGINLSQIKRKKISDQNLSSMSQEEREFNASLDLNISVHQDMILPYFSHCHAPKPEETQEECMQRMYRVQVAWDTKMALESYKLAAKLKKDEKLLVFAGAMHMENHLGIPLRFSRLSTLPTVSIIPVNITTKSIKNGVGDFLVFYKNNEEKN